MTEEQLIERGLRAEALLLSDDFNTTVEDIIHDLSQQFLATSLDDDEGRKYIHLTHHGMRLFVNHMKSYVSAKDEIARKRDEDANQEMID